jgi:hypothetical protein
MKKNRYLLLIVIILILASLACKAEFVSSGSKTPATPIPTPTMLPALAVQAGEANPQEPTAIFGKIPYTWPFFLEWFSEPFILLEDQAGFVERDKQFEFALAGQTLGPVTIHDDQSLTYDLALPSVPQGTLVDVDNNGEKDLGVQVFAVAYWDNTWGGLFLEERDGIGWSTAYSSTIVNPNNDDEIVGGTLVVWAPDDLQAFPTGFGSDGLLFTDDDPTGPLPAGYSIVDLNQEPFRNYKQARIQLDLIEGVVALNDYSDLSYSQAFDALFEKVSREYPFTVEKNLDWQALYNEFKPKIDSVGTSQDYYKVFHDFIMRIPDGHISISPIEPQVLYNESGGGFGLIVDQLTDGRVIATEVLSGSPAEQVGMLRGAEIIEWNGLPVEEALDQVVPGFGPA